MQDFFSPALVQIINSFAPVVIIAFVFIFLIFRPQYKKTVAHKKMLEALKEGDAVLMTSGIFGKIKKIETNTVHLDIGQNQVIKVMKQAIAELQNNEEKK